MPPFFDGIVEILLNRNLYNLGLPMILVIVNKEFLMFKDVVIGSFLIRFHHPPATKRINSMKKRGTVTPASPVEGPEKTRNPRYSNSSPRMRGSLLRCPRINCIVSQALQLSDKHKRSIISNMSRTRQAAIRWQN